MLNLANKRFRMSILLGVFFTALGGVFIGMYIWEAIIVRIGEPDQSLLFWYLPILFIGMVISFGGLVLLAFSIYKIREQNAASDRSGTEG